MGRTTGVVLASNGEAERLWVVRGLGADLEGVKEFPVCFSVLVHCLLDSRARDYSYISDSER